MEGIKQEFSGNIDNEGVLRLKMIELRQLAKQHPNTQVIVTVEILNMGDVEMMRSRYRNYILPRVVKAWRELGENYTEEQADIELVMQTTERMNPDGYYVSLEDLDRERLKKWTDEVTIFSSINLNLAL